MDIVLSGKWWWKFKLPRQKFWTATYFNPRNDMPHNKMWRGNIITFCFCNQVIIAHNTVAAQIINPGNHIFGINFCCLNNIIFCHADSPEYDRILEIDLQCDISVKGKMVEMTKFNGAFSAVIDNINRFIYCNPDWY